MSARMEAKTGCYAKERRRYEGIPNIATSNGGKLGKEGNRAMDSKRGDEVTEMTE